MWEGRMRVSLSGGRGLIGRCLGRLLWRILSWRRHLEFGNSTVATFILRLICETLIGSFRLNNVTVVLLISCFTAYIFDSILLIKH